MTLVYCRCEECYYWLDGQCNRCEIVVDDNELTAAGFVPKCCSYEEE